MLESHSRVTNWFKRKKSDTSQQSELETKKPQEQLKANVEGVLGTEIEGVVTDQKLLGWYYRKFKKKDTQPVATDKFMYKSKDEYNSAWLAREIVQNFVDENEESPYTLDGVEISSQIIDEETNTVRFTIRGNWEFEDPTGLTSLHSAKTEKRKTAGGNGIGLKQVALRYLRDFGIENFEIQGENWTVNYRLAKKDEINQKLENEKYTERLKHDWLVADIKRSENQGQCTYVIDTNNEEVIKVLQELPNLGVSETNIFLKDPDFKNEKGALKWLPITDGDRNVQGRLFINGQVMNFKDKGKTSEDYWKGPELVTIQLNDVDYQMSIDRPPINAFDLGRYVSGLIESMSKDELLEQLQKSEHIWSEVFDSSYSSNRRGCFVVIEAMVKGLFWSSEYNEVDFASYFGDKKYLCWDYGVSDNQIESLEKQGFIICSSYFEQIGMPKASSELDSLEAASNEKPQSPQYRLEKIAEEYGFTVACEKIDVKDPQKFLQSIKEKLSAHTIRIEAREERPNAFRIYLNVEFPKNLLFHQLPIPKTEEQKLLHYLRSVVFVGLGDKIFEKVFTFSGEYITTFDTQYDSVTGENNLLARNVKCSGDQGIFLEFELPQELVEGFKASLIRDSLKQETVPVKKTEQLQPKVKPESKNIIEDTIEEVPATDISAVISETREKQETVPVKKTEQLQAKVKPEFKNTTEDTENTSEEVDTTDISAVISETRKNLDAIPIQHPEFPVITKKEQRIVVKKMQLSTKEQNRLAELEEKIPEITEAIATLESTVPTRQVEKKKNDAPDKYLQWRDSSDFYGQATQEARYLTGRHLLKIVAESNQADIAIALLDKEETETERKMARLNATLKELANRFAPPEDEVDDFEIILAPTEQQLAKVGILRAYAYLTTQVSLPNDIFIYDGTGSKGVNIAQKAIGLHESLFKTDFKEILGTFVHEIAHNASMSHNVEFMHTMEALFSTINEELSKISEKLLNKEELSDDELMILELKRKWDTIG
ncbi:hypothetical protein K8R66_02670 [bacterium]|nr:hypothetical protein [bacterium]